MIEYGDEKVILPQFSGCLCDEFAEGLRKLMKYHSYKTLCKGNRKSLFGESGRDKQRFRFVAFYLFGYLVG